MRHMHRLSFTRKEMEADLERYERHWREHGFGLWAAEEKETGALDRTSWARVPPRLAG
jgi:hypothetical protein